MKRLCILGSTGSIGVNTLEIVAQFPDRFVVKSLAAKTNVALLAKQILRFHPEIAVVYDRQHAQMLRNQLPSNYKVDILHGEQGYIKTASRNAIDTVVTAVVGAAGLLPTIAAIDAGKNIALANKETMVMAGDLVMKRAVQKGADIIPVDSEHSAIFQSLTGNRREDVDKIFLTASGGPFLNRRSDEMTAITPEEALRHPNWKMGPKITIDSATMMNKGLEVIEAKWLFGLNTSQIEVLIHPQSIVHSMVAYQDGSVIAQMGIPDMKGAIAYALSCPGRLPLGQPLPAFAEIGGLLFEKPNTDQFPCLALAFDALEEGGTMPAVLNAANEMAVEAFLHQAIGFDQISRVIRQTMDQHETIGEPVLQEILNADDWARKSAAPIISMLASR